jgi:hypothetical protein
MGRVDGMTIEQRDGAAPCVIALDIGPAVLGHRLHPVVGRIVEAVEYVCGVDRGRPTRIPIEDVTAVGREITVAIDIGDTAAGVVEQRMRAWLRRLPGGR